MLESAERMEANICSTIRGMIPLNEGFSISAPYESRYISQQNGTNTLSQTIIAKDNISTLPSQESRDLLNVLPEPVWP